MRILMIAENDPAGTAILFARAVNALTPHTCRLVTAQTRYTHSFDRDLHLPDLDAEGWAELESLLEESDVFHFHMTADESYRLGHFTPKDYMRGKIIVHHHHGHPDFRGNPGKYRRKYAELGRRNLLVSTPDLLRLLPGAAWLPNLVAIDEPRYRPAPAFENGRFRLGHSPTRKDLKNTDELLAVVGRLQARGAQLDLDLMDDVPHKQCLRRKQACHAVFDHMQGYYGVSSLEALSQGKATIAGLDRWNEEHILGRFGCSSTPWVKARNQAELETAILNLVQDPDYCAAKGAESRRFMENHWNPENIASMLVDVYQRSLPDAAPCWTVPVTPLSVRGTIPGTAGPLAATLR